MLCAILLAAGQSRRMGTQKLLLPFGGSTLIGQITDELLKCPIDSLIVVTGRDGPAIEKALQGRPVRFVSNPDPDAEMLSSVRCGLVALPQACDTVLLALGDQPGIRKRTVERLVSAMQSCERRIVVPFYDGHRGHPFLFSSRFRDAIVHGYDDSGMRGFLDAHARDLLKVEVDKGWVLQDIDYPEDYAKALRDLGGS